MIAKVCLNKKHFFLFCVFFLQLALQDEVRGGGRHFSGINEIHLLQF